MSSAVNEPLDIVLSKYPLKILDIKNESYKGKKGVWWISTDRGMKILKKVSASEETLKFTIDVINHLLANGVNIPKLLSTNDDKPYVNIDGVCYTLTDAIDGRNPSYKSEQELSLVLTELAKLHKASRGFSPRQGTKPKYHLGTWVEDYTDSLEFINQFYENELQKKEHDFIGAKLLEEFPYFYKRAQTSIEGLRGSEYSEWVSEAKMVGCICHQDFAAGNLILTPEKTIYVLDTDSLTVDIASRDIRKLLNKVMKKSGRWDKGLTKKMLHIYQQTNPLSFSQWKVVKLDLMYPHLFLGAFNKYYKKREKEWSEEKYMQRISEMSSFEKTIEPILNDFESLIPERIENIE